MRILLADDQVKVRSALRLLLEQEGDMDVVAEAADSVGLLLAAEQKSPDVVLLDWELPGVPVADLVPLLRRLSPTIRILALSGRPEAESTAVAVGVDAFVSKTTPADQLRVALDAFRHEHALVGESGVDSMAS